MRQKVDQTVLWNEAAKAGFFFGAVSVGCLALKEWAGASGSAFLAQAALIVLWPAEFFGCILLMKKCMLDLRDKYEDVRMEHTRSLGRRAALLSGLLLASAQALFIMQLPAESLETLLDSFAGGMQLGTAEREQLEGLLPSLPLYSFIFQWLYCWLYGSLLASFMSRYIFLQKLFSSLPPREEKETPDEQ